MSQKQWLPLDRIIELLQVEPLSIILSFAVGSWIIYKIFLRKLTLDRHKMLNRDFKDLSATTFSWLVCITFFSFLTESQNLPHLITRILPYFGALTLALGAVVFVKSCKIIIFEYLFYKNMSAGVPVLVVNVFTILLSLTIGGWLASELFNLKVVPLLATSAIFSIVLGLALQDTLGNLFSGLALQIDKPYAIGDWIEVQSTGQKWIGEVYEISWRATILKGFTDEWLTIPNRIMAGAQISNFATKDHPIWRSLTFKVTHGQKPETVKNILLSSLEGIPEILKNPKPMVLISDLNESWIQLRLVYCILDYGHQYEIADQVFLRGLEKLSNAGIGIAAQRIEVLKGLS